MYLILALCLILIGAKLMGLGAKYLTIPAVVGELLAGILLGPSLLNWISPTHLLEIFAEIGVVLLLFEVGLETDFGEFKKAGQPALRVAITGFIFPGFFAFGLCQWVLHLPFMESLFISGALTATSIGITVRVLTDLHKKGTKEAHIVIGAAVFDDILGVGLLIILCLLSRSGGLEQMISTLCILAAFVLGLCLSRKKPVQIKAKRLITPGLYFFTPIFFVMIGVSINLKGIAWDSSIVGWSGLALLAIALLGKFLAGFSAQVPGCSPSIIGIAMIPRGEVGLIFAQLGWQSDILGQVEYTLVILIVLITTLLAPFLLRWRYRKHSM